MDMTDTATLYRWLKYVNNTGAKHRRLVGMERNPEFNATDDPFMEFIFIFDNGPATASEDPWPK